MNDLVNANEILNRTKELYEYYKKNKIKWFTPVQEWDESIPFNASRWARAEIAPICSFLGGIVSHEIIKKAGVYTPINQWLLFDFFETMNEGGKNIDRNLKGSRYDDQISIYGYNIQEKIENANIFLIGAGSIGCEFIKNFALI